MYQVRVFARRNKGLVGGVVTAFVVLVAGIIVSTSLYFRAEHARITAEDARVAESRQREIAEHNFALGRRHFSYDVLEEKLAALFEF